MDISDEPSDIGIYPSETRYSFEEVIETLFTFTMETYREEGFPKFILLYWNKWKLIL